jgi:hypothetical protein
MGERGRGVALYALFAVLLLAGGGWFYRAAPVTGGDPRVADWQDTAAKLVPDQSEQVKSDTIVVTGDVTTERTADVQGGSYALTMVCLGDGGQVRVRLSASGDDDSGRGVPCTTNPSTLTLTVALASDFFMLVTGETEGGTAVFRWRLERTTGF